MLKNFLGRCLEVSIGVKSFSVGETEMENGDVEKLFLSLPAKAGSAYYVNCRMKI